MIITKKKAFNICSNLEIVKDIPALHKVYELAKAKSTEVSKKTGCSSCNANKIMAPVYDSAMDAIMSLSQEDLTKLKNILGITDTVNAYVSDPNGVALVQLDK